MRNIEEKLQRSVTIADAPKAYIALRTYGLSEQKASEILDCESDIAINDYGIIPKQSCSLFLLEIFGEQHISDALSYAYHYMDMFKLDLDEYKEILNIILTVTCPEDLIANPDKINWFIQNLCARECGFITELDILEKDEIEKMLINPAFIDDFEDSADNTEN